MAPHVCHLVDKKVNSEKETIRQKLNMTADELPLVKVLQGGTWSAGRKIAAQLRAGGVPPIKIASDGTVF